MYFVCYHKKLYRKKIKILYLHLCNLLLLMYKKVKFIKIYSLFLIKNNNLMILLPIIQLFSKI